MYVGNDRFSLYILLLHRGQVTWRTLLHDKPGILSFFETKYETFHAVNTHEFNRMIKVTANFHKPRLNRFSFRMQRHGIRIHSFYDFSRTYRSFVLVQRRTSFQDVDLLVKSFLQLQILNARWKSNFIQAVLRAKGSKPEKCIYWPVWVFLR